MCVVDEEPAVAQAAGERWGYERSGTDWRSVVLDDAVDIVDITAPLIKAGILAAWMMVFAVTLRELSMAILLYVPGTETLPVAIYSFIDNGTFEIAAAVSMLLIALSIAAMLMLRWLTGKAQMEL